MPVQDKDLRYIIALEGALAVIRFEHGLAMIASRFVTLSDPEITIEAAGRPMTRKNEPGHGLRVLLHGWFCSSMLRR